MIRQMHILVILAVGLLLVSGCAGGRLTNARETFLDKGDLQSAVQMLEEEEGSGRSKLLYHMEKGLLLHHAGRFEESIDALRNASDLMSQQDYLSLHQQTASLLVNDWMTDYKGEYCERMWVHTYLMINYLLVYQYEGALVEAKQALKVYDAYPEALSEAYFSMALIGLCYELLNEYNDAYIVYRRLAKMLPDPAPVRDTLYRMGRLAGIEDSAIAEEIGSATDPPPRQASRETGEMVLFIGMGRGPVKEPGNIFLPPGIRYSFPRYENRGRSFRSADLYDLNHPLPATTVATNLNRVAKTSLGERAKQIFIKESARVVAKEVLVQGVQQNTDSVVGLMARVVMIATEEPDTRSWHTLPARNALLRLPLEAGTHHLSVRFEGGHQNDALDLPSITISKGRRMFFALRVNDNFTSVYGQAPVMSEPADAAQSVKPGGDDDKLE